MYFNLIFTALYQQSPEITHRHPFHKHIHMASVLMKSQYWWRAQKWQDLTWYAKDINWNQTPNLLNLVSFKSAKIRISSLLSLLLWLTVAFKFKGKSNSLRKVACFYRKMSAALKQHGGWHLPMNEELPLFRLGWKALRVQGAVSEWLSQHRPTQVLNKPRGCWAPHFNGPTLTL